MIAAMAKWTMVGFIMMKRPSRVAIVAPPSTMTSANSPIASYRYIDRASLGLEIADLDDAGGNGDAGRDEDVAAQDVDDRKRIVASRSSKSCRIALPPVRKI